MALYTFYPFKADGTSGTFVCLELEDDNEAYIRALTVLDRHLSAIQVAVWAGDRRVAARDRVHPGLSALLTRKQPAG
jgi:hypothetical protein